MLPPLYSQEHEEDPLVMCKFFTPDSNWTFYTLEFDGEDLLFGWVVGFEKELGYFRLSELAEARGPFGLPIERDLHFSPTKLSEVTWLNTLKHERSCCSLRLAKCIVIPMSRSYVLGSATMPNVGAMGVDVLLQQ